MAGEITVFQAVTLAVAVVGAVLGMVNLWLAFDNRRVKLRVVPAHAIPLGAAASDLRFCIEVTNLSSFPLTIENAGVYYADGLKGMAINPVFADGGSWPRRLEPRSSLTVYSQIPYSDRGSKIRFAYAKTQCGRVQRGTSPALRQIIKATPSTRP